MKLTPEFEALLLTDAKYDILTHAERAAIANAAASGNRTNDTIMYVTLMPCATCAGVIIDAGIKAVITPTEPDFSNERWAEKWGKSWEYTSKLFQESNVQHLILSQILGQKR